MIRIFLFLVLSQFVNFVEILLFSRAGVLWNLKFRGWRSGKCWIIEEDIEAGLHYMDNLCCFKVYSQVRISMFMLQVFSCPFLFLLICVILHLFVPSVWLQGKWEKRQPFWFLLIILFTSIKANSCIRLIITKRSAISRLISTI